MFVHNSGGRNVIHLFAMWCRVLQNMDERQSAAGMCGRARRMTTAWRMKKTKHKRGKLECSLSGKVGNSFEKADFSEPKTHAQTPAAFEDVVE